MTEEATAIGGLSCSFLYGQPYEKGKVHIGTEKKWGDRVLLYSSGLILGFRPASERQCYFVTTSLIGWVQARICETSLLLI